MNRLLVEIWTLKALLVKAQIKGRSMGEKAYIILENTYIIVNNAGRNRNIKGASGESSEGNEEHVIGNWKKGDLYYIMPESLAELSALMWKGELVSNKHI